MGSTVPRRQLGRALRDLRTEACMTLDGVAEALHCSRQKMWRIEAGPGPVRPIDARFMCELYGATREPSPSAPPPGPPSSGPPSRRTERHTRREGSRHPRRLHSQAHPWPSDLRSPGPPR
ncbi:helix-turn-helix domain-containing protein [Micromonospora sp. NBC_00421]|uniref:helix-turn-helix domain-containing protein n=1 Tax=Micromonospora sp. NBC_00421 TaxID=2975976 RepID=UPI003FA54982